MDRLGANSYKYWNCKCVLQGMNLLVHLIIWIDFCVLEVWVLIKKADDLKPIVLYSGAKLIYMLFSIKFFEFAQYCLQQYCAEESIS